MLRPKTKKRLIILLIAGISTAGIATTLVVAGLHRYENHLLNFRAQGMDAYHHGDYRTAAKNLASYLGNDRIDGEAIFAYAVSRSKLPRPDMGNLLDAKRLFNRYLEINPGDVEAQHQLLAIYQKLRYPTETMDTANALLKKNPDDVPALTARLRQLIRDQKFNDALPISMRLNQLTPDDARTQETTFDLMARTGKSPQEILDRGNQLLSAHPDDPRFQLVRALAAYFTSDIDGTKQWLRKAATGTLPDADFTLLLAGSFDHLGMSGDSRALLEKTATQPNASPLLQAKFVQRMWELGEYQTAQTVLNRINPIDPSVDSQLLGLDALVMHSQNHTAVIRPILDALNRRPDDPTAASWVMLLDAVSHPDSADVLRSIQQCQLAEKLDSENADTRFYLAQEYLRGGESELALQCFRQTAEMEPEWSTPQLMIANILLDRRQFTAAAAPAQLACDLDPKSTDAKITQALVDYHRLDPAAAPPDVAAVLDVIQELRQSEASDPKLLAANVDLLARTNHKTDATNLAATSTVDSPAALRELATIDRADQLGMGKTLTELASQCQMTTPQQTLDEAEVFAIEDDLPEGRKLIPVMQSHSTLDWQLATLQAREALHDETVNTPWQELADSQPKNLTVQLAAMHSAVVNADRLLMDRTIDRLKALSSDDAIEWKLARARWQLEATRDLSNNANAAAASMAEVVRQEPRYSAPQVIWADALVKLGDVAGAIAHLKVAAQLSPDDQDVKMKLAKLVTEQGQSRNTASTLTGL